MRIARLAADLEPHFNDHFDFLFLARFDTPQDDATIKYVSAKFNVQTYINRHRRGVGWPHGCNELFFGLMDYVYTMRLADKIPNYKFILNFEGDSCPLRRDWLLRLNEQWDAHKVKVLGPIIPPGPPATGGIHCNGNAMYSCDMDFLHWIARKLGGCSPMGGFDFLLAPQFRQWGWADCRIMRSWWHCSPLTPEVVENLQRENVVFLHGDKSSATSDVIRKQNGL
jgi:hypothetical protein